MSEPTVPVATLEKLWRSLIARGGRERRDSLRESANRESPGYVRRAWAHSEKRTVYRAIAADLRAIIDAAKGESR